MLKRIGLLFAGFTSPSTYVLSTSNLVISGVSSSGSPVLADGELLSITTGEGLSISGCTTANPCNFAGVGSSVQITPFGGSGGANFVGSFDASGSSLTYDSVHGQYSMEGFLTGTLDGITSFGQLETVTFNSSPLATSGSSSAHISGGFGQVSSASPVPEPGSLFLFGSGLTALAGFARSKRKAAV